MLIDSHCHLDYFTAEELPAVLARAADAGVGEMVTIGTRLRQAAESQALVDAHTNIWYTVGVHPHNAAQTPVPAPETIAALTAHPKAIGIGESGLDYFYDKAPRPVQQDNFRAHIRAAQATGLPLAIHARDADEDIAEILQEERSKGGNFAFLLHCFSSGRLLAEAAVAMGGYVSFSGILTFPKSSELRDIAGDIPADRLLVETDAPYLAPVPLRGKRNEPALVAHTARVLAETRGLDPDALAALTTANFRRLFPQGSLIAMLVTLLGTGASAGVPMIGGSDGSGDWGVCDPAEPRNRRTRCSIVVQGKAAGPRLLVDTAPDLREQILTCRVPRIDAILYTHAHADHITGLDDVRILNRICGHPLDAFGTEATLAEIMVRFPYAFRPWEPPGFYRPVLVGRRVVPGDTINTAGLAVRVFEQNHGMTRSLGLRVGKFGYSTDVVALDDAAFAALAGIDTWVVDCFQRHTPHTTHAHLDLVLSWVRRVGARRTVLTHMGTDMDWSWLCANLPPGVEPGFDGMVLEVPAVN